MRTISVFALAAVFCATNLHAQTYAITHTTVLQSDGHRLTDANIIVEHDRILRVGTSASVAVPSGAAVFDGRGKFVMPGLIDAHVHLQSPQLDLADDAFSLLIAAGVTTARVMYAVPRDLQFRNEIRSGKRIGPDLIVAAPAFVPGARTASIPTLVQQYRADGYDFIKVIAVSAAEFDSIAVASAAAGMRVVGHVPAQVGLFNAIQRMATAEHLDGFLEALVPDSVRRNPGFFGLNLTEVADTTAISRVVDRVKSTGVVVVPTEHAMEIWPDTTSSAVFLADPAMPIMPERLRAQWAGTKDGFAANQSNATRFRRFIAIRRGIIRELYKAGVPIVAGSDAINLLDIPGFSLGAEVETLNHAGLPLPAALATATSTSARALGLTDRGVIAPGMRADLLLLNADPLIDAANLKRIDSVMVNGRLFERSELDRMVAAVSQRLATR